CNGEDDQRRPPSDPPPRPLRPRPLRESSRPHCGYPVVSFDRFAFASGALWAPSLILLVAASGLVGPQDWSGGGGESPPPLMLPFSCLRCYLASTVISGDLP